jgi:pimeloyl-ACP methyl ester carboxylesterase
MSITPRRIAALMLIALTVAGLVRLATDGEDRVSVPSGARAGQLDLEPCTYDAEHAELAAECGTLVVPENRRDPQSRLIALPVTRIHARSATPAEPIFRLEGGPGLSNMEFPFADRYNENHDVVLVGYRGVDGSTELDCREVTAALKKPRDIIGTAAHDAVIAAFRRCANRFEDDGVDLAGYTVPQRVDDLEAAREALGYDKVDLLSESAGTRTALIYSWRHPDSIHRSVMVGVNPPGRFLWDAETTDEQIQRYAELCERDDECASRTGDLAATMDRVTADPPSRWLFLPVEPGSARVAAFYGLVHATDAASPLDSAATIDSFLAAEGGDPSGLWLDSFMATLAFPETQVWGDVAAIGRLDAGAARRHFAAGVDADRDIGDAATSFTFHGGDLMDAWPANADDDAYSRVPPSDTETLLIDGELDFATPPQRLDELMPKLHNARRVVLEGFGHTGDFWDNQTEAGTRLITTYLDTGRVDASRYHPQEFRFDPRITQTALAKGIAVGMVGLPLLCALALAGIAGRVRRRGRLHTGSSALVRSVFAFVAGLSGWMLAVIVDLATSAGVPVDDPSMAMVTIAVPVALSAYHGWSDGRRIRRNRMTGLAAAVASAIIGARLGFAAADGVLALITAAAGSVAGANLALIIRDTWAGEDTRPARRPRERPVAPPADALEPAATR